MTGSATTLYRSLDPGIVFNRYQVPRNGLDCGPIRKPGSTPGVIVAVTMFDFENYRELMPLVIAWLLDIESNILANGVPLNEIETRDAVSVGVQRPEKIRILAVDNMSVPQNPVLQQAGRETGLLSDTTAGRTVGYGIEIIKGESSRRLLRHEFRHVFQYEQAGSLQTFVTEYIQSVLTDGYHNSIFERDARAVEASPATPDD